MNVNNYFNFKQGYKTLLRTHNIKIKIFYFLFKFLWFDTKQEPCIQFNKNFGLKNLRYYLL